MTAIKEERILMDQDGGEDDDGGGGVAGDEEGMDGSFPMPTLSTMQSAVRSQHQQQTTVAVGGGGGGGTSTLMLRSLLTGANVPVVANAGVVQGVVSQTSPVTLLPATATDPNTPEKEDRSGKLELTTIFSREVSSSFIPFMVI